MFSINPIVSLKNSGYLLAILLPVMVLVAHALYYYPFFVDDAFISLRYAERFIEGKGLNWNDGEYVEGYSNLLWVLATALLGWLGIELVTAGRMVCVLAAMAGMGALVWHNRHSDADTFVGFLICLTYALTAPVAIWMIGGLEATLSMALLAWAYVLALPLLDKPCHKAAAIVGVLLGLVCLTRPEGAFFTITMAVALFVCVRYSRVKLIPILLVLCIVPFMFFAAQVGFRLAYYGDWLPNTYYAKVSLGTSSRLMNGSMYVIKGLASFLPLILLIVLSIDKLVKQPEFVKEKRYVSFLGIMALLWLIMLTLAGGDIFAGYRHLLPVVPIILLMMHEALRIGYASGPPRNMHIFSLYLIVCFFWLQCVFDENVDAKEEVWEWKAKELGEWLANSYGDSQPLIAASNTGAIPYYSKLPTLDMYGINDRYLTRHRGKNFGKGFIGHELFDSDYVLSRKPDMIIFFIGVEKALYGSDLLDKPEFQKHYWLQSVVLPSYTAKIWMRKDSPKFTISNK